MCECVRKSLAVVSDRVVRAWCWFLVLSGVEPRVVFLVVLLCCLLVTSLGVSGRGDP